MLPIAFSIQLPCGHPRHRAFFALSPDRDTQARTHPKNEYGGVLYAWGMSKTGARKVAKCRNYFEKKTDEKRVFGGSEGSRGASWSHEGAQRGPEAVLDTKSTLVDPPWDSLFGPFCDMSALLFFAVFKKASRGTFFMSWTSFVGPFWSYFWCPFQGAWI